jgi:hypothetical protein
LTAATALALLAAPAPGADGDCRWDPPPRPDSALDIPDPDDYLIPMEDGSYFLPDETVGFNGHTLTLAELQDLIMIAGDMGIGVEEAIFR